MHVRILKGKMTRKSWESGFVESLFPDYLAIFQSEIQYKQVDKQLGEVLILVGNAREGIFRRVYGFTVLEFEIGSEELHAKAEKVALVFVIARDYLDYL